jgi:hypothetical protein
MPGASTGTASSTISQMEKMLRVFSPLYEKQISLSKNLTEAFERSSQAANARLRRLFVSARRKASVEALPLRRHIKQELCGVEALAAFCLKFAVMIYEHYEDRSPTHGYTATREAAMTAFAKSWRRE